MCVSFRGIRDKVVISRKRDKPGVTYNANKRQQGRERISLSGTLNIVQVIKRPRLTTSTCQPAVICLALSYSPYTIIPTHGLFVRNGNLKKKI